MGLQRGRQQDLAHPELPHRPQSVQRVGGEGTAGGSGVVAVHKLLSQHLKGGAGKIKAHPAVVLDHRKAEHLPVGSKIPIGG